MDNRILRDVFEYNGDYYVVSTISLADPDSKELDMLLRLGYGNYETMIFEAAEDGEVTNWTELAVWRYDTEAEARDNHEMILNNAWVWNVAEARKEELLREAEAWDYEEELLREAEDWDYEEEE